MCLKFGFPQVFARFGGFFYPQILNVTRFGGFFMADPMSVENQQHRKAPLLDTKAILSAAIIGLGACFKLVYDGQIRMEHALVRSNEIQTEQKMIISQNIDLLKKHSELFGRAGTWQRIVEIRLTMIENELGIESLQGDK